MKQIYETIDDFKEDLNKEYNFSEIAEIMGWLRREEIIGGKIVCPFHAEGKERTASCQIGEHFFKCYGCSAKGDIFTFGMMKENKSFPEIIFDISSALHCKISNMAKMGERQKLLNNLKAEWLQYQKDFKEFVGKNKALADRYEKLFPLTCGYDKGNNRIVVAYEGFNGEIYGFTKRALDDATKPKWKHSDINKTLTDNCANLLNVQGIKGCKEIYLVEGPGDISGMIKAGYRNTSAICGTSHYNRNVLDYLISTIGVKSINLVMDGDAAGKDATMKNCRFTIINNYFLAESSFVVLIPQDKDPGNCTENELVASVDNKIPMIQYFLENLDKQELIAIFKSSKGKMIRNDIVKFIMETYNVRESECLKVLQSSVDEYKNDEKERLQATYSTASEFMASDVYKNMSDEKAKSILKRKYGIS